MKQSDLDKIISNLLNKDNGNIDVLNSYIDSNYELSTEMNSNTNPVQLIKDTLITDKKKIVELYNKKELSNKDLIESLKSIQKNNNNSLAVYSPQWVKKDPEIQMDFTGTVVCFSNNQQLGETFAQNNQDGLHLIQHGIDVMDQDWKGITEKVESYHDSTLSIVVDSLNYELQEKSEQVFEVLESLLWKIYKLIKCFSTLTNIKRMNLLFLYTTKDSHRKMLLNSVSGLIRNLTIENNRIQCKSVDLGYTTGLNQMVSVIEQEISSMGDYFDVSYSNGYRQVNVVKQILPDYATTNIVKKDGCYVIIGGMGKIGQIIVRHLVSCGASHIILVGRRNITKEEEDIIHSFNSESEIVIYKKYNILQLAQVSKLFNLINMEYGRIYGVYHTAGIIKDCLAINKQRENVRSVLEPKIKGTMNIVNAAKKVHAEFVMLFSSLASITGNMGQSDYGFANAFLDMYAESESNSESDTKMYSINWPLWEEGGMQVQDDRIQLMTEATGMAPLLTSTALLVMDTVICNNIFRSMVLYGQNNRIEKMLEPLCDKEKVVKEQPKAKKIQVESSVPVTKNIVQYDNDSSVYDVVSKYVSTALREVADIDTESLDEDCSFDEFGLDSIMIERMNTYFENDSLNLPKTILYEKNTKRELSNYIIENHKDFVAKKFTVRTNAEDEYQAIWDYFSNVLCKVAEIDENSIGDDITFTEIGLDSIMIEKIHVCLESDGIHLPNTIMYEKNTLSELVSFIIEYNLDKVGALCNRKEARKITIPNEVKEEIIEEFKDDTNPPTKCYEQKDIAIIGVDLKVAGAKDAGEFWDNIIHKKTSIREVPTSKWDHSKIYSDDINDTVYGKTYCKYGAFLEYADCFDAMFFNISPKEAEVMDPQERILLESVWRVLEDAGYTRDELKSKYKVHTKPGVGVFIGSTNHSYALSAINEWNKGNYTIPSSWQWAFANRISHIFDFTGPSIPVDTGCSSSMTALHLACKSIENGESSIAVVGGVNLYSHPTSYIGASKLKLLSANDEYVFLGEESDGFIPGEGVATILIKPLEEAEKDHDKIYGVIKGTAINHSGHTNTFFTPSSELEQEVLEKVARDSKIDFDTIDYIEMGTTGSAIGDPIEFRSLCNAFQKENIVQNNCAIGSVKPYIGHMESASGLVAIIKSLLQFKYNKIVPTLVAEKVNLEINLKNSPFFICTEEKEFMGRNHKRRALINSISAGGSYACAILESYVNNMPQAVTYNTLNTPIINISAKTETSLRAYLSKFIVWLEQNSDKSLSGISMMFQLKRECFDCKVAFVCNSMEQLKKQIRAYLDEKRLMDGVYDNSKIKLSNLDKSLYSGRAGNEFIKAIYKDNDMRKLAYLWTIGADIHWKELYDNKVTIQKMDLPCYEFERERYWITDIMESRDNPDKLTRISSMLDANVSTLGNITFSKSFSSEEFFIKDHLGILPAVAYIEMIYQAITCSTGNQYSIEVKNLVLVRPFIVREGKRALKVRFTTQANQIYAQVFTDTPCKILHAQCNIVVGKQVEHSLKLLKQEDFIHEMTGGEQEALEYYSHLERLNSCFGDRFKGIKLFYYRDKEAFVEAEMFDRIQDTKKEFHYHPTLLDAGFQSVVALAYKMGANPDTIYMPFVTENIEFIQKEKETSIKYIHVFANPDESEDPSKWKYTVEYYNEDNELLVRIRNYSILAVSGNVVKEQSADETKPDELKHSNTNEIDCKKEQNITDTVSNICAKTLKLRTNINPDVSLLEYGYDSITFTELSNVMNQKLGIDTNPVLFFEKDTVNAIVKHILEKYTYVNDMYQSDSSQKPMSQEPLSYDFRSALTSLNQEVSSKQYSDKYAIIGMSGTFPGSPDIESFWKNVHQGKDLITDIPSNRWNWKAYDGKSAYGEYKIYSHSGGFIEDVECFDAKFFKISPLDAAIMDPQQRLVLEYTWKAMEDAGYSSKDLKGTDTSIFIGVSNADYGELLVQHKIPTVLTHSMITNRVSFMLEMTGKSEPCDSACSSSLVAIHRAIEAIRSGESKMAFAGGVNLILSPNTYVYECLSQALSPTGTCKPFDESADGYARGEGVGVILIKRLEDAIADGDNIYATICGSAVQHAGKSTGLTVPNADAQATVIKKAYENAGVDMNTVTYIEAHGTGTKLGDPIEIDGLKRAMTEMSRERQYMIEPNKCALSSVKSNIGHLEAASGMASVIKVVKSIQDKIIVPTIHFQTLNPFIDLSDSPFFINREPIEYKPYYNAAEDKACPRRAGISSFGIGGVNAHIVLEEFENIEDKLVETKWNNNFIFTISAQTTERLQVYMKQVLNELDKVKTGIATQDMIILQRLCYTFQLGRDAFHCRCGMNVSSIQELELMLKKAIYNQEDENYFLCDNIAKYASWRKERCNESSEEELIAKAIDQGDFKNLIEMWSYGININWNQLYLSEKPRKLHVPTYPFKKDKYWIPDYYSKSSKETNNDENQGIEINESKQSQFTKRFSDKDVFLRDHSINGKMILPGAVYSAMVHEAASIATKEEWNCIKDMFWFGNIEASSEPIQLTISVDKKDEKNQITISSDKLLAKGTVLNTESSIHKIDLVEFIEKCGAPLRKAFVYQQFESSNMKFGNSFRTINAMWCSKDYSVVQYVVDDENDQSYLLNPRILDAAFQSVVGNESSKFNEQGIRVPFYMKKLTIVKKPENKGFILAMKKNSRSKSDNYDIFVTDINGNICVAIEEYVVQNLRIPNN